MMELDTKKKNGSYYTKPEIVSLILDLIGYVSDEKLYQKTLLEPSVGDGVFLIQAVDRMLLSVERDFGNSFFKDEAKAYNLIVNTICAIELDETKHNQLKEAIIRLFKSKGASEKLAIKIVEEWFVQADYLFWNKKVTRKFDYIIGNPPYIRIENLEKNKAKEYRKMYVSLYDRADIYVAFIEHGLEMLNQNGRLSFICTDRFVKNKYGKKIRKIINDNYRLIHFLDIHNSQPFEDVVSAYPCIFTIENSNRGEARTLKMDEVSSKYLDIARRYFLLRISPNEPDIEFHTIEEWFKGEEPWILNGEKAQLILQKLETENPLISNEPHNIKVGIGVATGANEIYIVKPERVDLEPEVLIPLVTKDDITTGIINWGGHYVINPYQDDGSLVDLEEYPKLKQYFLYHEAKLKNRNTAKNNPSKWYKTIDRIFPERIKEKKILIPDIKAKNLMVLDEGMYYPEHSLYYITAGNWDIRVLQALLCSSIIKFFIWSYATKMRGDYLRYQAQYLKKIRLPVCEVSESDKKNLIKFSSQEDVAGIDEIAKRLYKLTDEELEYIQDLVSR